MKENDQKNAENRVRLDDASLDQVTGGTGLTSKPSTDQVAPAPIDTPADEEKGQDPVKPGPNVDMQKLLQEIENVKKNKPGIRPFKFR